MPGIDCSMPFLDILVIPQPDGSLNTRVYRKPTNTDLYLQWDSHHTISAKYSVANTLHYRCQSCLFQPSALAEGIRTSAQSPGKMQIPSWALNMMKLKIRAPSSKNNNKRGTNTSGSTTSNNQRPHMIVPYTKGLSERLKNACSKHGVQVYLRGGRTIRSLLVAHKDTDTITKKNGSFTQIPSQRRMSHLQI